MNYIHRSAYQYTNRLPTTAVLLVVGIIYAVLLAFIAVTVSQNLCHLEALTRTGGLL